MFRNSVLPKHTQTSFSWTITSGFFEAGKKWFSKQSSENKSFQSRCRSKGFPGEVPPQNLQSSMQRLGKMRRQGSQARFLGMFPGFQPCTGFGTGLEQPGTRFSQDSPDHQVPEPQVVKDRTKCQRQGSQHVPTRRQSQVDQE